MRFARVRYSAGLKFILILGAAAAILATSAAARTGGGSSGDIHNAVYVETNDPTANAIIVYQRSNDGTLTQRQSVLTGGVGSGANQPFGFPITDSQGAVVLTDDGNLLFAVNAGNNSVSSFRVTSKGLRLVDVAWSGGKLPISVTAEGNVLYALNGLSGSIAGFHFVSHGELTPIHGSRQSLATPGANGVAAQIGLSPDGRVLTVTERCFNDCPLNPLGVIDTFKIGPGDVPVSSQWTPSAGPIPFGFAYVDPQHLLVTNVGTTPTHNGEPPPAGDPTQLNGSTSSYVVSHSGALHATGTVAAGGRATCWIVISNDQKYAFVTNSLSTFPPGTGQGALTSYRIGHDGSLTKVGQFDTGAGFPVDVDLSKDGKYLYVLVSTLNAADNTGHIDIYRVNGGNLTLISSTPHNIAGGTSGIAAN